MILSPAVQFVYNAGNTSLIASDVATSHLDYFTNTPVAKPSRGDTEKSDSTKLPGTHRACHSQHAGFGALVVIDLLVHLWSKARLRVQLQLG